MEKKKEWVMIAGVIGLFAAFGGGLMPVAESQTLCVPSGPGAVSAGSIVGGGRIELEIVPVLNPAQCLGVWGDAFCVPAGAGYSSGCNNGSIEQIIFDVFDMDSDSTSLAPVPVWTVLDRYISFICVSP